MKFPGISDLAKLQAYFDAKNAIARRIMMTAKRLPEHAPAPWQLGNDADYLSVAVDGRMNRDQRKHAIDCLAGAVCEKERGIAEAWKGHLWPETPKEFGYMVRLKTGTPSPAIHD